MTVTVSSLFQTGPVPCGGTDCGLCLAVVATSTSRAPHWSPTRSPAGGVPSFAPASSSLTSSHASDVDSARPACWLCLFATVPVGRVCSLPCLCAELGWPWAWALPVLLPCLWAGLSGRGPGLCPNFSWLCARAVYPFFMAFITTFLRLWPNLATARIQSDPSFLKKIFLACWPGARFDFFHYLAWAHLWVRCRSMTRAALCAVRLRWGLTLTHVVVQGSG